MRGCGSAASTLAGNDDWKRPHLCGGATIRVHCTWRCNSVGHRTRRVGRTCNWGVGELRELRDQLIYSLQRLSARPDGETGRRTGLKIPGP